jgi:hypothetical protein
MPNLSSPDSLEFRAWYMQQRRKKRKHVEPPEPSEDIGVLVDGVWVDSGEWDDSGTWSDE